jgi:hypothetical protein
MSLSTNQLTWGSMRANTGGHLHLFSRRKLAVQTNLKAEKAKQEER